jgi:poly(3-hydroxybutyrate) depolymerase
MAPEGLDDTYLSTDVPTIIRARYRVSTDPAEWGLLGYSSGGYCAANLGLRHRARFGAAAIGTPPVSTTAAERCAGAVRPSSGVRPRKSTPSPTRHQARRPQRASTIGATGRLRSRSSRPLRESAEPADTARLEPTGSLRPDRRIYAFGPE